MKVLRHLVLLYVCASFATATRAETLLDTSGPRELWAIPLKAPSEDFLAAEIVIRSVPGIKNVTLENLAIRGNVVQVWQAGPTALQPITDQPLLPDEWIDFDSHLLINSNEIFPTEFYSNTSETNDSSLQDIDLPPTVVGATPTFGIGDIAMRRPTDAFFFHAEYQRIEFSLARVVTPKSDPNVTITLGVLGEGCAGNCHELTTFFNSVPVSFVPESNQPIQAYSLVFVLAFCRYRCSRSRGNRAIVSRVINERARLPR